DCLLKCGRRSSSVSHSLKRDRESLLRVGQRASGQRLFKERLCPRKETVIIEQKSAVDLSRHKELIQFDGLLEVSQSFGCHLPVFFSVDLTQPDHGSVVQSGGGLRIDLKRAIVRDPRKPGLSGSP